MPFLAPSTPTIRWVACVQTPSPLTKKKSRGEGLSLSPIFSEGRGASAHRLFVGYQRFFLACDEEPRVSDTSSAEDTSGGQLLDLAKTGNHA